MSPNDNSPAPLVMLVVALVAAGALILFGVWIGHVDYQPPYSAAHVSARTGMNCHWEWNPSQPHHHELICQARP